MGTIVSDGLVGCWDVASARSYPGSGTTWTDLSKEGNNGTLTNGPTLRVSNNSSIKFDGTNDHVDVGSYGTDSILNWGSGNGTIVVWMKTSVVGGSNGHIVVMGGRGAGGKAYSIQYVWSSNLLSFVVDDDSVGKSVNGSDSSGWTDNKWHYVVGVRNGQYIYLYVDGVLNGSTYLGGSYGSLDYTSGGGLYIGTAWITDGSIGACFDGQIASTHIYNRALTAAEIKQNYYATKGRFDSPSIVTENLIMHLDAGDSNSYSGSGTTWTDLAGSNDGTLTNGPTFSNSDGGEIVFDGSDDHVTADNISILSSAVGTISFWVNIDSDSGTENDIVSITNNASATQSFLRITADMRSSSDYIRPKLVIEGVTKWAAYTSIDSLDQYLGKFLYVTIVQNGIEVYCYFNGQSETLTFDSSSDKTMWISDILTASSPATCMTFGGTRRNGSFGSWSAFDGRIADISIYNRALTAAEILQNYRALKGRFV